MDSPVSLVGAVEKQKTKWSGGRRNYKYFPPSGVLSLLTRSESWAGEESIKSVERGGKRLGALLIFDALRAEHRSRSGAVADCTNVCSGLFS